MTRVSDILNCLETIAPKRFSFDWDNVGLQVGRKSQEVKRVVVALDRSLAAIEFASSVGAQLLLTHHPLFLSGVKAITDGSYDGRCALELIRRDISLISAHTNWDSARGGINDALAEELGLVDLRDFGTGSLVSMTKLVVFVPLGHRESLIDALTAAGAGTIGNYRRVGFYSAGTGTFEPMPGANPHIGTVGVREEVNEERIEMLFATHLQNSVVSRLRESHPYEEPAFDLVPVQPILEQPAGRVGRLIEPTVLGEWVKSVSEKLGFACTAWGSADRMIRNVALVGGAADGEWEAARSVADVLLTGEVKQHRALEAQEAGFALIQAGHYATEQPGVRALAERIKSNLPELKISVFEPEPGSSGRPLCFI